MMKHLFLTVFAVLVSLVATAQSSAASDQAEVPVVEHASQAEASAGSTTSTDLLIQKLETIAANPVGRVVFVGCAFALMLLTPIFMVTLLLFMLLFIFKYDGVKSWFDRRAGAQITPQDRFDKLLWRFVPFYATIVIGAVLLSEVGGTVVAVLAVAMPILCWRFMVGQRAALWGSRRIARWEMIYIVYAGFAIFLGAILLWWALIYYLLFKLVKTFVTAPSRYTCGECSFYEGHRDGSQNGYCRCHHKFVVADHSKCSDFS